MFKRGRARGVQSRERKSGFGQRKVLVAARKAANADSASGKKYRSRRAKPDG